MEAKTVRKTKKRDANFQRKEKIALIKAVEARPCLWRTTEKKYFDKISVKSAWQSVAAEMNKEASECKSAWTSLRDSLRYHRSKLAKSSSAGGIVLGQSQVNDIVDWQFAEHMAFLPVMSLEKRTKTSAFMFVDSPACSPDTRSSPLSDVSEESMAAGSEEPNWVLTDDELEASTSSVYSSQSKALKRRKVEEPTEDDGITGLVRDYLNNKKKARTIFPFWDELLSKLPADIATATEVEITNLIYLKVQQHGKQ